jgi:hypothetical protein
LTTTKSSYTGLQIQHQLRIVADKLADFVHEKNNPEMIFVKGELRSFWVWI